MVAKKHAIEPPAAVATSITPGQVNQIITSHMAGQFSLSALVADAMLAEPYIQACLQTRISNIVLRQWRFIDGPSKTVNQWWIDNYEKIVPESVLATLIRFDIFLGFAIAQIEWTDWCPRVRPWHPSLSYYNLADRQYMAISSNLGAVPVSHGDGQWVLHSREEFYRAWVIGIVRSLLQIWLDKAIANRDWMRYSEVHGLPIKKLFIPGNATGDQKKQMMESLGALGSESVVPLLRPDAGQINQEGWDLDLLEASVSNCDAFSKKIAMAREDIAVAILGQNLTTLSSDNGSYAAAESHMGTLLSIVARDIIALQRTIQTQIVEPITCILFGHRGLAPKLQVNTPRVQERQDLGGGA